MVYLIPRDDKTIDEADAHGDPLALRLGAIYSETGLTHVPFLDMAKHIQ
jgi:hypothetical protein